jgi:hypothetical protein
MRRTDAAINALEAANIDRASPAMLSTALRRKE